MPQQTERCHWARVTPKDCRRRRVRARTGAPPLGRQTCSRPPSRTDPDVPAAGNRERNLRNLTTGSLEFGPSNRRVSVTAVSFRKARKSSGASFGERCIESVHELSQQFDPNNRTSTPDLRTSAKQHCRIVKLETKRVRGCRRLAAAKAEAFKYPALAVSA